jgi:flagellar hook protein FlgE
MIAPVYSSMSALRAYHTQMGVTADNIANVNTADFKKSRVVLEEEVSGGVRVNIERVNTPGSRYTERQRAADVEKETSNVQLEEELPRMMVTQRAYEANLKALQTYDGMLGSLLDILG